VSEDSERKDPEIGEVQWHSSEEGGGPDVGILMGLGNGRHLWLGELLDGDGGGVGFIVYGPDRKEVVARLGEYDEVREVVEEHIAPALRARAHPQQPGKE